MAAHPIAVIQDGIVEIPDDVKSDPRFRNGAKLQLVPLSVEDAEENVWTTWRKLEGSWAHSPVDPNAILEEEKQRELADEARWRD